jgi:parvulin-like peptidyl-prolyl isomerase
MNSQTARRSERPTRSAKNKKYVKQTAHVSARRDGKPLIFGWGGHLSHSEKTILQRRAIWTVTTIITLLLIGVFVLFWVNINVINPNRPITTVNGEGIPQSDYRKMVAVQAEMHNSTINGPHGLTAQRDALQKQLAVQQKLVTTDQNTITNLNAQIKKLPAGTSTQRTTLEGQLKAAQQKLNTDETQGTTLATKYQDILQNQIPQQQQLYTQSQVGNDSADWLQQDALIRQWLAKQSISISSQIAPSPAAVNQAVQDFMNNIPKNSSYQKFLSDDNITDADVHTMMTVKVRRDNMQKYLASQIVSPTRQVLARAMTLQTPSDAQKILAQLKTGADFGKLANTKSVDTATKTKGGDLGWMVQGEYTINYAQNVGGTVDNWIFDPARTLNQISPVLSENGTYHIVQIMGIDPSRTVDATTLQSLKTNALTTWVLSQKALPGTKITDIDQTMLLDSSNMPSSLPVSPPSQQQQQQGLPGSSGMPGQ